MIRFPTECRSLMTNGAPCLHDAEELFAEIPLCKYHLARAVKAFLGYELAGKVGGARREANGSRSALENALANMGLTPADVRSGALALIAVLADWGENIERPQEVRCRERARSAVLYFARSLLGGDLVKIGVSQNLDRRMAELHAEPIGIATTSNARRLEKILHARFANQRVQGEWFKPSDDLRRWMIRLTERA